MKKTVLFVLVAALLMPAAGCKGRGPNAGRTAGTETIAPPPPQPAPTGTDSMTQTVDIEDSRSEDDGGVLTSSQTAKVPGAKTTTAKPTAKKKTKK